MKLLVVGAGAMGRWFATATDEVFDDVAFADRDAAAAEAAAETVGGRPVPTPPDESFDAVCLAIPMPAVTEAVAAYADRADRALVDVTGVMGAALDAMATHAPDRERVSLHPLFAPDRAPGTVAVVPANPGPITDRLRTSLAAGGNDLFETTAAEHDEAMASVQGAAHAALLAYALASRGVREEFHTTVSGPLEDLAERVLSGNPRVYADIQATFDGAEAVADAARRVAEADGDGFRDLYAEAGTRFDGRRSSDDGSEVGDR